MSPQYGELRLTSVWDRFVSLGHPRKFQRLSRLGSVTARYSSSGRQPNFAVLNRGRQLHLAGRPSRWAPAHILVSFEFTCRSLWIRITINQIQETHYCCITVKLSCWFAVLLTDGCVQLLILTINGCCFLALFIAVSCGVRYALLYNIRLKMSDYWQVLESRAVPCRGKLLLFGAK